MRTVGASGGTVELPGGPRVDIPAGALDHDVTIAITETTLQGPDAVTPVYQFEPAGLEFLVPAHVTFPVTSPAPDLLVFWSKLGGASGYDPLTSTVAAADVSADITHFSYGYVAPEDADILGPHAHYVIDSMQIPQTNLEARELGLDLNGDVTVDNQFGAVLSTLGSMGIDIGARVTTGIDRGESITLVDVQASDFTSSTEARFATYVGATPNPAPCTGSGDTTCRHHLTGSGTFSVAASSPSVTPLEGAITSGTLAAGSGNLPVQINLISETPITLELVGARTKAMATANGISAGVICGGIPQTDIDTKILPAMQAQLTAAVAADCTMLASPPACGCAVDSTGKTALSLYDANHDCTITLTELQTNSLIVSLFAPDVMIGSQMVLSFGFGYTAVNGTFTTP